MTEGLGNSGTGALVETAVKMRAWDALPKALREQLMTAPYSYNPSQVAAAVSQHGETAIIKSMDRVFQRDVSDGYSERGLPYIEWEPK